jgi:hypothetical protein
VLGHRGIVRTGCIASVGFDMCLVFVLALGWRKLGLVLRWAKK